MVASSVTSSLQKLSLGPKDTTATPTRRLLVEPLIPSGALNAAQFPRTQLTPAIGVSFGPTVKLAVILRLPAEERDALLRDLAILIAHDGVAFFEDQADLTREDLATLGLALGTLAGKPESSTLHIHPTQELGENGSLPIGNISNVADKDGRQISFEDNTRSKLSSSNWHTDVAFEPVPAAYTILKMHTIPSTGGDTLWLSGYKIYDALSPAMASFLEGLTATHDGSRFREQSNRHGYKLHTAPRGSPENVGDRLTAVHPVIRTHPVTGLKSVYVNVTFTTRINELNFDESRAVLDYLFRLQHESHDSMVKYKWSANNVAIWDNAVTTHLATFDYTEYRAGDRVVVCGSKPYYDPASTGRKESLAV